METIKLWRILDICKDKEASPIERIESALRSLENVKHAQKNF
jgi:hypothetical protein